MKFNKETGRWEDLKVRGKKGEMSSKAFKARALAVQERCLQLRQEAQKAAVNPFATEAEKAEAWDSYHAYSTMALDWGQTAMRPSDLREEKEAAGSEKGISNRQWGAKLSAETEELKEAILEIYKPGMAAERLRQKLESVGIKRSKRACERWIKKIRDNEI